MILLEFLSSSSPDVHHKDTTILARFSDKKIMMDSRQLSFGNSSRASSDSSTAIGYFNAALAPLSLIFNLHLIFAFFFSRSARITDNILEVNLSFVNVITVGLAHVPFTMGMLGLADAQIWHRMVGVTTITLSLAALFLLTIDRYVAIYYPFLYHKFQQPRRLLLFILGSCLITFANGSLTLIARCRIPAFVVITIFELGMAFFMIFAHIRVLVTLYKIYREVESLENRFSQAGSRASRNLKGIRSTVMCLLLFLFCHTPYSVLTFRFIFFRVELHGYHFYIVTLPYIPTALIPVLAIWTNKTIQVAIFNFYSRLWNIAISHLKC